MIQQKRWQLKPQNIEVASKISSILNISPIIGQLLINRQKNSITSIKDFIDAPSTNTQFSQKKLEHFLTLINECINNNQPIFLYGDYDVDGMTSTSMMVKCLTSLGATVRYKLPHRFKDGYGLNTNITELIKECNCGLLITLDCGVTNVNEIQHIRQHTNANVIIIDHHQIPKKTPTANLMINPKEPDTPTSLTQLCTAGIVYKIVCYIASQYSIINLNDYLILAAIGTVADVVDLQEENRQIVKKGLLNYKKHTNLGLKTLLKVAQFKQSSLSVRDIGFIIAPRLNAAGRLSTAEYGVDLLLTQEPKRAEKIAYYLESINQERRELDQQVVAESVELVDKNPHYNNQSIIVLGNQNWHAGVIGIAASKLVEAYHKPVVIVGIDSHIARGSARSIGNVNIYTLLAQCNNHFLSFGGHKQAAGFSLDPNKFDSFKTHLEAVVKSSITNDLLIDQLNIDMKIQTQDISFELIDSLALLEPYGHGNAEPIFYSDQFNVIESRLVGAGKHLKLTLQDKTSNQCIDAIGFNLSKKLPITYNKQTHFAFSIERNVWNQTEKIQLNIKDIK